MRGFKRFYCVIFHHNILKIILPVIALPLILLALFKFYGKETFTFLPAYKTYTKENKLIIYKTLLHSNKYKDNYFILLNVFIETLLWSARRKTLLFSVSCLEVESVRI